MTDRSFIVLVFSLAAIVMVVPAATRDFWMPDEPRYAEIAQEMMWSGDYLVPRFNGELYREKPPLLFWFIALSSAPFGEVTEFSDRIPSLLSAMVTLLLTFALARRMFNLRVAIVAVIVLAFSNRFWWQGQNGQIDMLLCASMTLSFYGMFRWHESHDVRWLLAFYTGIALGLFAKGPPALLFPALAALFFYGRNVRGIASLHPWIGVPAAISPTLLWFLSKHFASGVDQSHSDAVTSTLYHQIVGRVFLGVAHAAPPWYYLQSLPVDWLPWSIFFPWTVYFAWRHRKDNPSMRLLLAWIVPAFIFFSFSVGKRALYLLPVFPAIAIVVAAAIDEISEQRSRRWVTAVAGVWTILLCMIAAAPFVVGYVPNKIGWRPEFLSLTFVAILGTAWTIALIRRTAWRHLPVAVGLQFALLQIMISLYVFPVAGESISAKEFMAPIRVLVPRMELTVYSATRPKDEYLIYSKHLEKEILTAPGEKTLIEALGPEAGAQLARALPGQFDARFRAFDSRELGVYSDGELADIRSTCIATLVDAGVGGSAVDSWVSDIEAEIGDLVAAFDTSTPVFAIVPLEHWPWMRAFMTDPSHFTLVTRTRVRSHDMMLLGNKAAVSALAVTETYKKRNDVSE